jgi:hypothetical protein
MSEFGDLEKKAQAYAEEHPAGHGPFRQPLDRISEPGH